MSHPFIKERNGKWVVGDIGGDECIVVSFDGRQLTFAEDANNWAAELVLPLEALPALQLVLQKIAEKVASA